jgi:hypothetical protein
MGVISDFIVPAKNVLQENGVAGGFLSDMPYKEVGYLLP